MGTVDPASALPSPPAAARRVSVAGSRLRRWLDGFATRHDGIETREPGPDVVLVRGVDGAKAWVSVPFPPLPPDLDLLEHVERRRRVAVLLVRRGGYACGVFDGETLIASKVGSSYVQGTTKAGGWSQQRYARRRANQAHAAFAEAADTAAATLLPIAGIEALVCGGDRAAVDAVLADRRLAALVTRRTGPLLPVADPRLRVLQATPDQFLAVRIDVFP